MTSNRKDAAEDNASKTTRAIPSPCRLHAWSTWRWMSMVADEDDIKPVGAAVHRGNIEEEKKSEASEKCDISLNSGGSKEAEEEK